MPYEHDFTDNYLYWDNVESLDFTLNQQDGTTKSPTSVICQRVDLPVRNNAIFSGVEFDPQTQVWRVAAALLLDTAVQYPLRLGDTMTDGTTVWQVVGPLQEVRLGSSLDHYLVATMPHL